MATRKKAAPKKKAPPAGKYRLDAAAVQDSLRLAQGIGSASRKGLFHRFQANDGSTLRVLPSLAQRGANKLRLYYYSQAQHWIEMEAEGGETFRAGITCYDFMREEQPLAFSALEEKDLRCAFCEFLEAHRDDDGEYDDLIPFDRYGKPELLAQKRYNVPVILPEDEYEEEDPHIVKIYSAPVSVIQALDTHLNKHYPDLLDPEIGRWVDVKLPKNRNAYNVTPHPNPEPVWFADWEQSIPNLEEVSPRFMPYEEQVEYLKQTFPGDNRKRPARKKAAGRKNGPSRKAVAKRVRRR